MPLPPAIEVIHSARNSGDLEQMQQAQALGKRLLDRWKKLVDNPPPPPEDDDEEDVEPPDYEELVRRMEKALRELKVAKAEAEKEEHKKTGKTPDFSKM